MKITIVGTGNAGSTVAADLSLRGHDVILLKTSNKLHNEHFQAIHKNGWITIEENGNEMIAPIKTSTDYATSIPDRDLIIIYVQTNYHEQVIREICKYIQDDQTVLVEPGYLATCYFLKYCQKRIKIAEAESSPVDCRIVAPGRVRVLFRNVINPVGVFPLNKKSCVIETLNRTGYPFECLESVVEAALHNPNLIVHTIGAIFSVPRIEYVANHGGTYSMYREFFSPNIWNLVESLDNEKMDVLEKMGFKRLPYVEACKHRNSTEDGSNALAVFFEYANNSAPDGPDVPDSRYIMEDVPQGLVLLESLGKINQVPTPVCSGLIDIASAILLHDFRKEGRTVEHLGASVLRRICNEGSCIVSK